MSDRTFEDKVNNVLESILNDKFGNNVWLAETIEKQVNTTRSTHSRPDLTGYVDGIKIVLECSYDASDALYDARKRVKSSDIVVALHYPRLTGKSNAQISSQLQKSKFRIQIVYPHSTKGTSQWITVSMGELENYLFELSADLLKNIDDFVELIKNGADSFAQHLLVCDPKSEMARLILNLFYRHLGQDDWPLDETYNELVIYKNAYLSIVLSAIFYQTVRPNYPALQPLESGKSSLRRSIISQFERMINDVNYEPVFYVAINVLEILPDNRQLFQNLLDTVYRIVETPAVLHKDLVGRLYHQIVGSKKVTKGLATYFTQIPSSYLLARLAITDKRLANGRPLETTVADFACGSGTLLMAAYSALSDLYRSTPQSSPKRFHRRTLESNLYGFDVLRYALQITALNLLLRQPSEPVDQLHLTVSPLSGTGNGKLGSLELLSQSADLTSFLPFDPRIKGTDVVFGDNSPKSVSNTGAKLERLMNLRPYDARLDQSAVIRSETARIVSDLKSEYGNPEQFAKLRDLLFLTIPELYSRTAHPTLAQLHSLVSALELSSKTQLAQIVGRAKLPTVFSMLEDIPRFSLKHLVDIIFPHTISQQLDPKAKFDLVIMNPPFTRASRGGEAGNTVFGFTGKNAKKLNARLAQLTQNLTTRSHMPASISSDARGSSALAGLGFAFLHLAVQRTKPGGRVAFVVPRGLIQGATWGTIRQMLLNTCHIEFIISRMDGTGDVNFSESTGLSEIMFVATKRSGAELEKDVSAQQTKFCTLKTPLATILDAIRLTAKIQACIPDQDVDIVTVRHSTLQSHVDNWGRYAAFLCPPHQNTLESIESGSLCTGIQIPMLPLGEQCRIGVVSRRFQDSLKRGSGSCRVVWGGGEKSTRTIHVSANESCHAMTSNGKLILERNPGNLLVPDRVWLDTIHAFALWCDDSVLSNTFFAIRLTGHEDSLVAHKALCAWLNSVWGIITILGQRTDTRGKWSRLSISRWRMLSVPDLSRLPPNTISSLASVLDNHLHKDFGRFPHQFDKNSAREEFDCKIAECLVDSTLGDRPRREQILREIRPLYSMLMATFDALSKQPTQPDDGDEWTD